MSFSPSRTVPGSVRAFSLDAWRALARWIRAAYGRELPADVRLWHRWTPFVPVRLADGKWSTIGQIWRRRTATGWEYRQDPETADEFADRQW